MAGRRRTAVVVFGTRPEAIKLGSVILALRDRGFDVQPVTTGQHRELVHNVLPLFGVSPVADLRLMRPEQSLDYVLGSGVERIGSLLARTGGDVVVVQGDTTSCLAAALAAHHHRIPLAHVEAGLRTHDPLFPFPEEQNRRLTSVLARWHFAPTAAAAANLAREGIVEGVTVTGNTVVDAVHRILETVPRLPGDLARFVGDAPYVVATAHRRESWGEGIARVALALTQLVEQLPELRVVFVAHPNPMARKPVAEIVSGVGQILLVNAVPYPAFLRLLAGARLAISDSGGVQEEGPTLGVPVVVTRDKTERPEGIEAGAVTLAGTDTQRIVDLALEVLTSEERHRARSEAGRGLYGDGHAAERIAAVLADEVPR